MTDKSLTESDWKSFAKREKLDDPKEASKDTKALYEEVLSALEALAKKDEDKHDEMLAALDKLDDALTKQVAANAKRKDKDGKAIKDTKAVKDQLYKMLAAVEKQRKDVAAAKDKASADEEEESPALLTSKMLPLIREVRKGELTLEALIAVAGQETVVLVSRRAISPARGKLLKEQMTSPGGLKFIRGQCLFEAGAVTFVVQAPAAGLAKKLQRALFAQVDLRLKVRVRGEDPDDLDEEGEQEDGSPPSSNATPSATTATGSSDKPAPPDPARLAFAQRLLKLKPDVDKAATRGDAQATAWQQLMDSARDKMKAGDLAGANDALATLEKALAAQAQGQAQGQEQAQADAPAQDGGADASTDAARDWAARVEKIQDRYDAALRDKHPESTKLRALMGFASEKADEKHDYPGAIKALGMIEQLLAAAPAGTSGGGTESGAAAPANGLPKGDFVRMQTCRLIWEAARKKVSREIADFRTAVEAEFEGEPEEFDVLDGLEKLDDVMVHLDDRLVDTLDEMLQDGVTVDDYQSLLVDAKAQLTAYERFVDSHPVLGSLEGPTEFGVNLSVASTLQKTLQNLHGALR